MKISLDTKVKYPTSQQTFCGIKGKEFINRSLYNEYSWDRTDALVKKIKKTFGFNTEKSDDILEAFVDEVKNLRRELNKSKEDINNLERYNHRLNSSNREKESTITQLKYEIKCLRYRLKRYL